MAKAWHLTIVAVSILFTLVMSGLAIAYSSNESAYTPDRLQPSSKFNSEGNNQSQTVYAIDRNTNSSASGDINNADSAAQKPSIGLLDYTFDISAKQLFPNEAIRNKILESQSESEYQLKSVTYNILGEHLEAKNATVFVRPSKIDDGNVKLEFFVFAQKASITGADGKQGVIERTYDNLEVKSIYGIYNHDSGKISVHVPYGAALSLVR